SCERKIHMLLHSSRGTQGIYARTHPQFRWLMRLLAALARARSAVLAEFRARRDVAELAGMEDRMLRDIGVSRSEINALCRGRVTRKQPEHPSWHRRSHQDGTD